MENDMTTNDLAKLMMDFATRMEGGLQDVKDRQDKFENWAQANLVTKSYLDDKLADLRGDTVSLLRKEDQKVDELVKSLEETGVLKKPVARSIIGMGPFPKLSP